MRMGLETKVRKIGCPSGGCTLNINIIGRGDSAYMRCAVTSEDGQETLLFCEGAPTIRRFLKAAALRVAKGD